MRAWHCSLLGSAAIGASVGLAITHTDAPWRGLALVACVVVANLAGHAEGLERRRP